MIPDIKFLTIAHVDVLNCSLAGRWWFDPIEPGPVGSRFFLRHFQLSQNPCCFAVLIHIHSLLVLLCFIGSTLQPQPFFSPARPRPLQSPRNSRECLPKPNHRRVGMAQCWWTCWSVCWKPPRLMRGTSRRNRPCCSMKDWEIIWMIWNDLTTTSLWMTGSQGNYSQAAFCSRLMRLL